MATPVRDSRPARVGERGASLGLAAVVLLVAAAALVPAVAGWRVEVSFPPLAATWRPRVGPGTVPAVVLAAVTVALGPRLAADLPWRRLLVLCVLADAAWTGALAAVDGRAGIAGVLGRSDEYLPTARAVHDVPALLHGFVARIPLTAAPHNWPTHVAGHPPGALLVFVLLARVGLGGDLAAGLTVVAVAATTPVAALVTLRRLGAGAAARTVAPVLVVGPAAVWTAVSADALFGAVAAWGLAALAVAATSAGRRSVAWAAVAGLLLGCCAVLSYGLVVLAVLAAGILAAARSVRPVPVTVVAAVAVVVAFALAGFSWWDAYPVLRARYWAGLASRRPGAYWTWADLAALCCCAGPALGAGTGAAVERVRTAVADARAVRVTAVPRPDRAVLLLATAAWACVAVADASQMSRAEVERIWLPFVPWLLVSAAFVPARRQRALLVAQVVTALLLQSALHTPW